MVASSNSSITSNRASRSLLLLAGVALLLGAALRLFAATGLPDTPDAIRLLRSLERFDLLEFSPHFPGYPLAVASARTVAELADTPTPSGLSWSWLQAIASLLLAPLTALLTLPADKPRTRAGVIALLALHPFLALESIRVGTDFLALPGIFAALLLLRTPEGSVRGGVLLGLSLGFRPSLFPWLLALCGAPHRRAALFGATIGLLAWILPTAAIVGGETWLAEGIRFVAGHFTEWGGSVGSSVAAEGSRLAAMLRNWGLEPLAPACLSPIVRITLITGTSLLLLAALLTHDRSSRPLSRSVTLGPLGFGVIGYGMWLLLAQNPANSRHVLPFVPLALAALVACAARGGRDRRGSRFGFLLAALLAPTTFGVLSEYRGSIPPPLEAARLLAADPRFDPLLDRIYVADDRPFFTRVGPHWSIGTVFSKDELERDLISLPTSPRHVWISSSIKGFTDSPSPPGAAANDSVIIARRDRSLAPYCAELRIELRIESEPR